MDEKIDEEDISQIKDNISRTQSAASAQSQPISSIEKNKYRIQAIFEHYCSIGDSENLTKLKNVKYIRLLRDCGLVKPLNVYPLTRINLTINTRSHQYLLTSSTPNMLLLNFQHKSLHALGLWISTNFSTHL